VFPEGTDVAGLLQELSGLYANRGVNLVHVDGKWAFRTAGDLGQRLQIEQKVHRRLSRAALAPGVPGSVVTARWYGVIRQKPLPTARKSGELRDLWRASETG